MHRSTLLLGPLLLLASTAAAFAQDVASPGAPPAPAAVADVVRELGPFGAMAWGAWLLSGAVRTLTDMGRRVMETGIPLRVELSEKDREAIEGLTVARRAGPR